MQVNIPYKISESGSLGFSSKKNADLKPHVINVQLLHLVKIFLRLATSKPMTLKSRQHDETGRKQSKKGRFWQTCLNQIYPFNPLNPLKRRHHIITSETDVLHPKKTHHEATAGQCMWVGAVVAMFMRSLVSTTTYMASITTIIEWWMPMLPIDDFKSQSVFFSGGIPSFVLNSLLLVKKRGFF